MRVGVVEDDPLYGESVRGSLEQLSLMESIRIFQTAEELLEDVDSLDFDILILDISLPGMSGIDLSTILSLRRPEIKRIILTTLATENLIFDALRSGCLGYLLKSELDDLGKILTIILEGGAIMSPTIALRVLKNFSTVDVEKTSEEHNLSKREKQILEHLAQGNSPQNVATALGISIHTVRSHLKRIYEKLNVKNRIELMKRTYELGFLKDRPDE